MPKEIEIVNYCNCHLGIDWLKNVISCRCTSTCLFCLFVFFSLKKLPCFKLGNDIIAWYEKKLFFHNTPLRNINVFNKVSFVLDIYKNGSFPKELGGAMHLVQFAGYLGIHIRFCWTLVNKYSWKKMTLQRPHQLGECFSRWPSRHGTKICVKAFLVLLSFCLFMSLATINLTIYVIACICAHVFVS